VVCQNDKLAGHIKGDFPRYTLRASMIKGLDTGEKIEAALELYDYVTLPVRHSDNETLFGGVGISSWRTRTNRPTGATTISFSSQDGPRNLALAVVGDSEFLLESLHLAGDCRLGVGFPNHARGRRFFFVGDHVSSRSGKD